jgi:predicted metal-dependent hydrolase
VAEAEAARFVGRHVAWVRGRMAAIPPARPFVAGAVVPVLGVDHVIRHDPALRGAGRREGGEIVAGRRQGGEIVVGGRQAEQVGGRVRRLLIAEARALITARAHLLAAELGVRVAEVALRDTSSRWGSCSAAGRLMFSWRLILTPESVLDYVIAHEVAHLREMNHSPRFWAIVARLTPDAGPARAWLRAHGAGLLRFG